MSSFNLYGGTPKKTLDLMCYFKERSHIYIYSNLHKEFAPEFADSGGAIYEGFYGNNLIKHISALLTIIDRNKIDIVQVQFSKGEVLGFLIKAFRPRVKLLVAFVGAIEPTPIKKFIASFCYRFVDKFIYISEYVRSEKTRQFSVLSYKEGIVIYNGTRDYLSNNCFSRDSDKIFLFDTAALSKIKNIKILIEALFILKTTHKRDNIFLSVAGDGPERECLELLIQKYGLEKHISLLGYQSNIRELLDKCDIFVHPCYVEGFGIAVAEAMFARKPIVASNAGALPELIKDKETGFLVNPHDPFSWADAILLLADNASLRLKLGANARKVAESKFSVLSFVKQYDNLYESIIKE